MSGRLKNFTAWATGNYAAGVDPWSGTIKRVANAGRCFVPKVLAGPQEVNDAIGECIDNDNAILALLGQSAAQNWLSVGSTPPGSLTPTNFAADAKYGRMAIVGQRFVASANQVYFTKNGGRTWTTAGGAQAGSGTISAALQGLIFSDTGTVAVATYPGATDLTTVTDEVTRLGLLTAPASSPPLAGIYFSGHFVFLGRDGSSNLLKTSTGGSFGNFSGSVPSAWNISLSWYMASSGTKLMAVSGLGSTDNSFLLTSDTSTWTTGTFTLPGGYSVIGMSWAGDRWAIGMSNGTDSRVYTSTNDGASWTLAATLTTVALAGMSSLGTLLFATQADAKGFRGIYSIDGGVTWTAGTNWDGGGGDRVYSAAGRGFFTISGSTGVYSVSNLQP